MIEKSRAGSYHSPPAVTNTFIRISENLQGMAEVLDATLPERSRNAVERIKRVLKISDCADIIAEEHGRDSESALLLKLTIVARETGPLIRRLNKNEVRNSASINVDDDKTVGHISVNFLKNKGLLATLPDEMKVILIDLINGTVSKETEKLKPLFTTVDSYLSLTDERWKRPDVALSHFLRDVVAKKIQGVELREVKSALKEKFSDPEPEKGKKRFKPYRASFRRLAYAYFEALNDSEINNILDIELSLSGHAHFKAVGLAIISYFKGSIQDKAVNYPKKISEEVLQATALTIELLEGTLSTTCLSDRMNYLLNVMPYNEYREKILKPLSEERKRVINLT